LRGVQRCCEAGAGFHISEALPLLAFTLAQLAEGIRRGGQLSATPYTEVGGVRGALTRQADAALTDAMTATGRDHREILAGLLRLVTVDEQGRPGGDALETARHLRPIARSPPTFVPDAGGPRRLSPPKDVPDEPKAPRRAWRHRSRLGR
ncbi:MAG TPA: hypothetical protein VHH34_22560, partial [Pseudonocardiaceae bacterium]|nr:hypothetical protein [Pseudonocardiaceae bacterium]